MNKVVQVGNIAPSFSAIGVWNGHMGTINLSDYLENKNVILLFYPLDFTFVCPTELIAFSDRFYEFHSLETEILGISVDSQYSHLNWLQSDRSEGGLGKLNFPLVSDLKKEISRAYNVLNEDGVALRGLFIIDKQGILQHATINNLGFGRSVDEAIRVLQAIQHVQKYPDEVCPINWKPGIEPIRIKS